MSFIDAHEDRSSFSNQQVLGRFRETTVTNAHMPDRSTPGQSFRFLVQLTANQNTPDLVRPRADLIKLGVA